jgi:predicted DNA-binding transcriptional regulator AlpA
MPRERSSLSTHLNPYAAAYGQMSLPALIDVDEVGAITSFCPKTIRRMADSGRLPRPIRLGRAIRWRRDEILRWIEAGCPSRDRWDALNSKRK